MTTSVSINDSDIAVIGISCRFPGARSAEEFWQNLKNGVESIAVFSDEELLAEGIEPAILARSDYVKAGAVLADIDQFDAGFFGFAPSEAQVTDPQQRIFLECAWEALEDAGYTADKDKYSIGVYAGAGMTSYLFAHVPDELPFLEAEAFSILLGNDKDYLATHASYKLDLKGPGVSIQTACSTSLVATHMACQSLINGECDIALAGGISARVPHKSGYFYHEAMMLSPDGHCRAFDADSHGTVPGNGAGIVALKRLADALADGDNIYAVIKGSAINNDGAGKVGFTAPSVEGQAAVISEAQAVADVDPDTISYVEAHGTGTNLGDPIEIAALTRAFRHGTDKKGFCPIGSVKSNLGHLDAAAGVAGLIKTVLALKNRKIPASLHFKAPNPNIDFANSPFYVNAALADWESEEGPRRAGVSSFGMGGTNAHMVLEEAPVVEPEPIAAVERPLHLLTLSAKTAQALSEQAVNYGDYLNIHPEVPLPDVCFTAANRRSHFDYRLALVADSIAEARERLRAKNYPTCKASQGTPRIAFLFTGQGSQYVGMGRQLFETQPLFRETLQRCDAILRPLNVPLLDLLYGEDADPDILNQTIHTQPALFSLEYALARLWLSWGLRPDAVMGHSVGEYVAACIAGVFSLEDGLTLIAARGRLMQTLCEPGDMSALPVSEGRALELIAPFAEEVSLAAINSPESVVIAGDSPSMQRLSAVLTEQDIKAKPLSVSHAFHSLMMEPMLAEFEKVAASIAYASPTIPVCSNVTGAMVTEELGDPAYWVRQVRQPVRFAAGVETLHGQGIEAFLEIGPKPALLGMAGQCLPDDVEAIQLPSLREGEEDWRQLLESLGQWHMRGGAVDWKAFDKGYPRRKVQLPTYPFQRQRYWIDMAHADRRVSRGSSTHPLLGRKFQLAGTGEIGFESEIGALSIPWLVSHRIFDAAVLPATAYLEMALAAAADFAAAQRSGPVERSAPVSVHIQDVAFEQALILPEEETTVVQLVLSPQTRDTPPAGASPQAAKEQHCGFQVFSQGMESQWISHVTGQLIIASNEQHATEEQPDAIDLAELLSQCPTELSAADQYPVWRARGLDYGADFQAIEQLFRGEGMAMGKIDLPELLFAEVDTRQEDRHRLHPALFDACLQVMFAVMFDPADTSGETWLPTGMKKVSVYRTAKTPLWSVAKVVDSGKMDSDQQGLTLDISVFDKSAIPVARIEGLAAVRMNGETLRHYFKKGIDNFYEIDWAAAPLPDVAGVDGAQLSNTISDTISNTNEAVGSWLVFADSGGLGEELARALEQQGDTCILAYTSTAPGNRADLAEYHLDPAEPADFERLFAEALQEDTPPLKGIVHLWSLDAPETLGLTTEALTRAQILSCGSVLHLLQAAIGQAQSAGLWLVTRNAVSVGEVSIGEGDSLAVAQAPLWGLGKVIAQEHPELWGGMIDNPTAADLLAEIRAAINSENNEDQVAYRSGQRYVARLVKSISPPAQTHTSLHPEKSYLITGGLGKLGLRLARWMVEKGARNLVLAGRSGPFEEAQAVIAQLRESGAEVRVINADVAIETQAARLFREMDTGMPPLKGIVHAAGIVDRETLLQQNWDQFSQGMAAKVEGSWHLHVLSQSLPLDFFVFFSSSASLFGGLNMGSYAAANTFMDVLAGFRAQQGLPGLSIDWSFWADGGMSGRSEGKSHEAGDNSMDSDNYSDNSHSDNNYSDNYKEFMLSSEKGMEILDSLTGTPELIRTSVFPGSLSKYLQEFYPGRIPPFLFDLSQDTAAASESIPIKHRLKQASEKDYETILADFILENLAAVLRINPTQVDVRQPLNTMGLDSLMTVRLRNRIRSELGADISLATFMGEGTTVLKLVAEVDPRCDLGFNVKPQEALQEGEEEFKV